MIRRRPGRVGSRPMCALALLTLLLFSSVPTVAAFVQGEWRAFGGMALGCDGQVKAMVASPEGIVYLGGSFGVCGNVVARNVVAFDPASGEFSTLGGTTANGVDNEVSALVIHQGQLYVAGTFTRVGADMPAARVARWDGTAWYALGSGLSNSGQSASGLSLAVHGDELVVGGRFSHAGDAPANNIARWDGTGWHAFEMGGSNGVDGLVTELASDGTHLYAGGYFSNAGSVSANRLAAWSGGAWHTLQGGLGWGGGIPPQVSALEVHAGNLYVGGYFTTAGGVSTTGIARWDGASWHAIGSPSHVWGINSISAGADGLVVTGVFAQAGGVESNGLARWDGTQWHAMGTGLRRGDSGAGLSLLRLDGDLYVGGLFTFVDDSPAVNLARFSNGEWQPAVVAPAHGLHAELRNNAPHWPTAMASFAGSLYAAGRITLAGDQVVNNIARWDGAQWHPLDGPAGMGVDDDVHDLLEWDGVLWVAGRFSRAGGLDSPLIARWNGNTWLPFQPDLVLDGDSSATIRALATDGQNLYVAGRFTSIGGVAANSVARWDGQTWHALADGLGAQGHANDLAMHDGELFLAGRMNSDWADPAVVMRWDGTAWQETEGQFAVKPGTPYGASVHSIVSSPAGLIAIGRFLYAGGLNPSIARRGPAGWGHMDGPFGTGFFYTPPSAIAVFGESLAIAFREPDEAGAETFVLYRTLGSVGPLTPWVLPGSPGGDFGLPSSPNRGGVTALAFHQGRLFAAGGFSTVSTSSGRKAAHGLAALEPDKLFSGTFDSP